MNRTAYMMKRASAQNELAFKIANGIFLTEADKASNEISDEAKQGLALIRKGAGCNSLSAFIKQTEGKQDIDNTDPIQKLIEARLRGVTSPEEAQEVIGTFAVAYQKKDLAKMAKIVEIEAKVMSLILLWYVRDDQSLWQNNSPMARTAASRGYNRRYKSLKKVLTLILKVSEGTLSFIEKITGGASDWIVRFLPATAGKLIGKPIKWALLTGTALKAWPTITQLVALSKPLFALAVLKLKLLVGPIVFGSVASTAGFALAVLAVAWFGYQVKEYLAWAKGKLLEAIKLPFASLLLILKTVFKGGYSLLKWAFRDIKGYIRDNRALLT